MNRLSSADLESLPLSMRHELVRETILEVAEVRPLAPQAPAGTEARKQMELYDSAWDVIRAERPGRRPDDCALIRRATGQFLPHILDFFQEHYDPT